NKFVIVPRLLFALGLVVFCLSITRYITEPQDNTRCHSMLNKGKWLTEEYKQWQPAGCMSKTYRKKDIGSCLGSSRIIYIGDSIMREQYYAMTQFLRPGRPSEDAIHADQKVYYKTYNITIEMWWDPYLNTSKTIDLLEAKRPKGQEPPSILIIGSGIWYMRKLGHDYLTGWKQAVDRVFDGALHHHIADRVMLSPVEIVEYDLMTPERKATLTFDKINIMNNYLKERKAAFGQSVTPLVVPFVWNEIVMSSKNQTADGLHFKEPVTQAEAQLTRLVATPILDQHGFSLAWLNCISIDHSEILSAFFVFGLAVTYMYLGDRTQLFGKIFKQFDIATFSVLMVTMATLGLVTLKTQTEGDAGFLNRNQTEEWKGWMQLVILIYHFTGASHIAGIYNPVRVLVAAYLFQTGYGHFYFFYTKKDFSIGRILNVMVRLNLLSCVLAYLMKTDYLFYYFSPLVSFWFGVIWFTMRIMSAYNHKTWFILSKIVFMSLLTAFIIHYPGVLEAVFQGLEWLFKIQWNVTEWRFRLSLDCWIVYVGMLVAFSTIQLLEHDLHARIWSRCKMGALVASFLGLFGFFWFELLQSKITYTTYHPYISWIPIVSFIVLRNFTRSMRNTHSRFFAFIGNISLETFIGQFHMWLAADTRGLLVVLPQASWVTKSSMGWWLNLVVSSLVFFFVCYYLSQATGAITQWICSGAQTKTTKMTTNVDAVPLLPTVQEEHGSRSSSSSSHHSFIERHDAPNKFEEDGRISEDSILELVEETLDQTWYKTLYQNYWIKSFFFLVTLGIVNRFCS
ncbi:hypothetical protein CU098_001943, partial [Rhizopus stolonifer]